MFAPNGKRRNLIERREFLSKALLLSAAASLTGCGGGQGGVTPPPTLPQDPNPAPQTTRAKLTIDWGTRTRGIDAPSSALSAKVTLLKAKSSGGDVTWNINRATDKLQSYSDTYTAPEDAQTGHREVGIEFYADTNAGGAKVGIASAMVELNADGSGIDTIKTQGTIRTVLVNPGQSISLGETKELSFSARDSANNVIAVSVGSAAWTLASGGEKISITTTGQIRGLTSGQASVTVTVDGIASIAEIVTCVDPHVRDELMQFILAMKAIDTEREGTTKTGSKTTESGETQFVTENFHAVLNVSELAGFNPNIGVIWPGALVQGSSLKGGTLAAINTERTESTLLLSTLGVPSGGTTRPLFRKVPLPSASTIEEARSLLIRDGFIVPAKLSQVFKQFFSLEHAMMQIGASVSYLGNSLKAQLESEKFATQTNVMVAFTQEYYTIAAEPPTSPISYLGANVTAATLQPYANTSDNPICYVQGVTYGRMGLLLASSSESYESLSRSVQAAVRWATGSADANYGDTEKRIMRESEVKMLLMGGSPDKALRLIPTTQEALATMEAWIKQPITATPSDIQLGVPISYRVNYLKDNQLAKLSFSSEYDRTASSPIPKYVNWHIVFNTADDDKDNDTRLLVEVYSGSTLIAHLDENGRTFGNGSTEHRDLSQVQRLFVRDAGNIRLHIHIDPNGHDEWDFGWTLTAQNSAGGAKFARSGHWRLSHDNRDGWG